jgi:hypothetical protein
MNSKSLLIAIAALALTASGAQAFNSNALITAGLSEEQRVAFTVARELREEGDVTAARDILIEAGIDAETLEKVRSAIHAERYAGHNAMKVALAANDFNGFTAAIKDLPLADVITSEEDFKSFKEAHELLLTGDRDGANVIFEELGVPTSKEGMGHRGHRIHGQPKFLSQLSNAQKAAFGVARQANDRDAMEAILDEAGIVKPTKGDVPHRLRDGRELH